LIQICYQGDEVSVDKLLEEGFSVTERDEDGWKPLMYACCLKDNTKFKQYQEDMG